MTLRSSVFGFLVAYLHSTKPCWHSFALFDCCFGAVEEVLSVEVLIILCPSSLDYWLAGVFLFCLLTFGVYSHLFLICFLSSFYFCLFIPIVFIFFLFFVVTGLFGLCIPIVFFSVFSVSVFLACLFPLFFLFLFCILISYLFLISNHCLLLYVITLHPYQTFATQQRRAFLLAVLECPGKRSEFTRFAQLQPLRKLTECTSSPYDASCAKERAASAS